MKKYSFLVSIILGATLPCSSFAQEHLIDVAKIPVIVERPNQFAPVGWKVESIAKGDLNGDGKADCVVKLIEAKVFDPNNTPHPDRNRVLIVALADNGGFRRIVVTDKLLQCTGCGGALYGVIDAPANVSIIKGVIVVKQDHGSRGVVQSTFRFRYDDQSKRFLLIGYDYNYYDRALAIIVTESTNYLTGLRIITHEGKGKRATTKRIKITPTRTFLDAIDADEIEYAAGERLGLG